MKRDLGRNASSIVDWVVVATLGILAVVFWKYRIVDPATKPFHYLQNADFYLQIYPMAHRAAE